MEKKIEKIIERNAPLKQILRKDFGLTNHQISQAKFRIHGLCINGKKARVSDPVNCGDLVSVLLESDTDGSAHLLPFDYQLQILYEDEDLLAVHKPADMVTHPSPGHYADTLSNAVVNYYQQTGQTTTVRPIGRLDKDTSGIIVFGKNQVSALRLRDSVQKTYFAVASGLFSEHQGIITTPLKPIANDLMKMQVCGEDDPLAQSAYTAYQVLTQNSFEDNTVNYSKLCVKIQTGRTHQIRVHLASIGHALLGDPLYGQPTSLITRTALHAWKAEFQQPFTGKMIYLEDPIPEDMASLL